MEYRTWRISLTKSLQIILIILAVVILSTNSFSQSISDTSQINRKKLRGVIAAEGITAAASLSGLYVTWYSRYPHTSFHFFNDNGEWLQMDKLGHATTAYFISRTTYNLLRWPGVSSKKAAWYGGATGFAYLAIVELLDGSSAEWGFSPGDFAANTIGAVAFTGQQLTWDEQRILLKWSWHETQYPHYRPNMLGSNLPERMLKDYNGQTYWLSVNVHSFLQDDSKFPKWLNVALGYSADGMLGGNSNLTKINGNTLPSFGRTRQYFLSLDLDLTRVKTRSKTLNAIFNIIGVLKMPFPAIEYNSKNEWVLHGLYF
jgi:hypothetical protein